MSDKRKTIEEEKTEALREAKVEILGEQVRRHRAILDMVYGLLSKLEEKISVEEAEFERDTGEAVADVEGGEDEDKG
jgi:hypothetical protein